MISMSIAHAAQLLDLPAPAVDGQFKGVASDSRKLRPGMLFAALPGARSDGHAFVAQAAAAGAAVALVNRAVEAVIPQLIVADVQLALGELARAWRLQLDPLVVAITGSNGKTTTREMVANMLGMDADVLASEGNYNNELGLPLTLFRLEQRHQFAVLEMGASKAGDIRYLADIARPDVGLVTNVGPAHLSGFGDEAGVARAKGELYEALPPDGLAVINLDQPWVGMWRKHCSATRRISFSASSQAADVYGSSGPMGYVVHTPQGELNLRLQLQGEHNLANALAAAAIGCGLGIALPRIRMGLEKTQPVPGRLNVLRNPRGWTVIDDTYNANPASLYAALRVLATEPGEPWLVLGDMLELGDNSRKLHAEMGEAAANLGIKRLFTLGELSSATASAFGSGARHYRDQHELLSELQAELGSGVTCLVKGSRSMGMEKIVQGLSGQEQLREAG